MTSKLFVARLPFKPEWMPSHVGCATRGHFVGMHRGRPGSKLMYVSVGVMDAFCSTKLHRHHEDASSPKAANVYAMAVYAALPGDPPTRRTVGGRTWTIRPGTYLVVNPLQVSRLETPFAGVEIQWSQLMLREVRDACGISRSAGPFDFDDSPRRMTPALRQAIHRVVELTCQTEDRARDVWLGPQLYGAGVELLSRLWESHPNALRVRLEKLGNRHTLDMRLEQALCYCRDHLAQPLTTARIAREVGMGSMTLHRLFHAHFGVGPHKHLQRMRMDSASQLLQRGASFLQAAQASGFRTAWGLRQAFRAAGQTVPSAKSARG